MSKIKHKNKSSEENNKAILTKHMKNSSYRVFNSSTGYILNYSDIKDLEEKTLHDMKELKEEIKLNRFKKKVD